MVVLDTSKTYLLTILLLIITVTVAINAIRYTITNPTFLNLKVSKSNPLKSPPPIITAIITKIIGKPFCSFSIFMIVFLK